MQVACWTPSHVGPRGKAGPIAVERLKLNRPVVNVLSAQASTQQSAGPLGAAGYPTTSTQHTAKCRPSWSIDRQYSHPDHQRPGQRVRPGGTDRHWVRRGQHALQRPEVPGVLGRRHPPAVHAPAARLVPGRRRGGHSAAPPSPCSRRFNTDGEGVSVK